MKREPAPSLQDDCFFSGSKKNKLLHRKREKKRISDAANVDIFLNNALLLLRQDHLLTLVLLLRQSSLLSVLPNIVFTSLNRRQLISLDLSSLLNSLRHMALAFDSPDLGHVGVSVDQGLVVLQLRALTSALDSAAVGSVGTPKSDVAIVGTGEDVLVVGGKLGREDTG